MRAMRSLTWLARYGIGLVVMTVILLLALVLAVFIKLGEFADGVYEALMALHVMPDPRGVVCKACRGRGRVIAPDDGEDEEAGA